MELSEKHIIVTGGANGIGKILVNSLVREGANICVFDYDEEAINNLKINFPDVHCVLCDITNSEKVQIKVEEYFDKYKKIDVLVNNAALILNSPLINFARKKHDIEQWKRVIDTDLNSVFYMTVNVVEKMIISKTNGVIVNLSSVCASGNAGQSAYSAAKAGVEALTVTWAKELGVFGIRVAGVAPGYIDTETTRNSITENVLEEIKTRVPLRRLGLPEEIADGIIFIIKNDFFNGRILRLDGGIRI